MDCHLLIFCRSCAIRDVSRLNDSQNILRQVGGQRDHFHFRDLVNPSLEELVIELVLSRKLLNWVRQILEVRSDVGIAFNRNLSSKPTVRKARDARLKHRLD